MKMEMDNENINSFLDVNPNINFSEGNYKGQIVEFSKVNDGTYKIERVISTDPQVYLKKDFQPGSIIKDMNNFFIPTKSEK